MNKYWLPNVPVPIPPTPVTAETYAQYGYPFFELYERQSGVSGCYRLQSVGNMDKVQGNAVTQAAEQKLACFSICRS